MSFGLRPLVGVFFACAAALANAAGVVNVYSARQEDLIKPLLDMFSAESGVEVKLVTGDADQLLQRLTSEGRNSPADLFITTDAGRLFRAQEAGMLQSVHSKRLDSAISAAYRHAQGYWYGLSLRARPIIYAPKRVSPDQLSTYEALAEPRWKGRICVRSSGSIYNQSLVAAMIASLGESAVETWAKGFVANFARAPKGGDRDQIMAVAAGECDIALANTYYLAGMLAGDDAAQREAAQQMKVFWPNQGDRGTHVNISGVGVTAHAPHKDEAVRLLEFMAGDRAQHWYAEKNHEYPVKPGIAASEVLQSFGEFKADTLNLTALGDLNAAAVKLMDRAGWR